MVRAVVYVFSFFSVLLIIRESLGGVGVVVYFRKEGRALGEVTK
jgi:GTP cyclohydrolase II